MIRHVYERSVTCPLFERVVVATDDSRISAAVKGFGGEVAMTSPSHVSGTDRVAEVAQAESASIIVNIQGDEPFVNARVLEQVVRPLLEPTAPPMATLCKRISERAVLEDPNVVKVVTAADGTALYFSRSPIPYPDRGVAATAWEHIGIYAYRRDFLLEFSRMEPTQLELAEGLEQLRVLERGHRISVVPTEDHVGVSVDTPDDLRRALQLLERSAVPGAEASLGSH